MSLQQASPFAATQVSLHWDNKPVGLGGLRIHELPPLPDVGRTTERSSCLGIGAAYNPSGKPTAADAPLPGLTLELVLACSSSIPCISDPKLLLKL